MIWYRYVSYVCCVGVLILTAQFSACSTPTPSPLTDPVFRLSSTKSSTCLSPQDKKACQWEIKGVIDRFEVARENDNPFSNCTQCRFNQKFAILDGEGGLHFLYYSLPTDELIPLKAGETAHLIYIEGDRIDKGFAMTLRNEKSQLIAAFASGQGGQLLSDPNAIAFLGQIKISENNSSEAGRENTECGTKIYRSLIFKSDIDTISLNPGQSQQLTSSYNWTYRVTHVNRFNWQNLKCNDRSTPFAYFLFRNAASTI